MEIVGFIYKSRQIYDLVMVCDDARISRERRIYHRSYRNFSISGPLLSFLSPFLLSLS